RPHAAQAQAEPAPLRLDPQDAHAPALALLDNLARIADVALAQLRDVDQPLDAVVDAGECPEGGQLRDRALDDVARVVLLGYQRPRLRLGAPQGERDLLVLPVAADDHDVDLVAGLDDVARLA